MENEGFFGQNHEGEIQEWLVGYKMVNNSKVYWETIILPGFVSKKTVEGLLYDLNEDHEIVYSRKIMGVSEKAKKYPKGDFLGL